MKVITCNLNGIRSAATKGFFDWMAGQGADFVGVQEIKAQAVQIVGVHDGVNPYVGYFHYADKKGYSGVGLYSRHTPSKVVYGLGNPEFDAEGRWVELRFDDPARKLSVISCYFPSGSSGEPRQEVKFRFLDFILPRLRELQQERDIILMGDLNIAHQEIDLKNWRGNRKNSGFLPEERAWMTDLLQDGGLVDVYRRLYPDETEQSYTWWSNRGQAYAKNVGWRIDYQLASGRIADTALQADVYKEQRFSDHAPLIIDYGYDLAHG